MFETQVTLVGKVVGDVSRRRFEDDVTIAHFRLMTQERKFVRETGEWTDGDRMFVTVRCWRKLGDNVLASLARGDQVVVTGRLYHREYETEGKQRLSVEVDARSVGPDLSRCTVTIDRHVWDDAPAVPVAA
ncbi:single-stranded DNA-binding protein [Actinokineospora sp.]|uniref:single-stranded DNA-binding protein n=1 Tax=Actinokineospora sp. TaxID=1872133 RepID=UPI004037AC48